MWHRVSFVAMCENRRSQLTEQIDHSTNYAIFAITKMSSIACASASIGFFFSLTNWSSFCVYMQMKGWLPLQHMLPRTRSALIITKRDCVTVSQIRGKLFYEKLIVLMNSVERNNFFFRLVSLCNCVRVCEWSRERRSHKSICHVAHSTPCFFDALTSQHRE